jgi:hypothetical protein
MQRTSAVLDFIEVRKWLQKGLKLQQDSNLCHDSLIPNQANWRGKPVKSKKLKAR